MAEYKLLPLASLVEPTMPVRFSMDDHKMDELVESIRANGIFNPLIVVPGKAGEDAAESTPSGGSPGTARGGVRLYEIVAGHRRYKAACIVQLPNVPCLIFPTSDIAREAVMLDENLCREDITPCEEAVYYSELVSKYDLTIAALLKMVHRTEDYVEARLALTRGHDAVFHALAERKITLGVATAINRVKQPEDAKYILTLAIEGGATIATVHKWVADYRLRGAVPAGVGAPGGEAGPAVSQTAAGPVCFLCGTSDYPGNMVMVHIHDFERDRLVRATQNAGSLPPELHAEEPGN